MYYFMLLFILIIEAHKMRVWSLSWSHTRDANWASLQQWMGSAQKEPIEPAIFCSYFAQSSTILYPTVNGVSTISKASCIDDISFFFKASMQKFSQMKVNWISDDAVFLSLTIQNCSKTCQNGVLLCGREIPQTSLLTQFTDKSQIMKQIWVYDFFNASHASCEV